MCWAIWQSPIGKLTVGCSDRGVHTLALGHSSSANGKANRVAPSLRYSKLCGSLPSERSAQLAKQAIAELREYVRGERKRFTVPLDLRGTPFQMKVWKALLAIPYGETRSYQQIAHEVGNPRASRAVGMANHYNPVGIIVPCHRVIARDGSLGGYAGGLKMKERILKLEQG